MLLNGYMTAEEMKCALKLKAKEGDNRTLNKYVREGKLDVNPLSRKVHLYKLAGETPKNTQQVEDWIF